MYAPARAGRPVRAPPPGLAYESTAGSAEMPIARQRLNVDAHRPEGPYPRSRQARTRGADPFRECRIAAGEAGRRVVATGRGAGAVVGVEGCASVRWFRKSPREEGTTMTTESAPGGSGPVPDKPGPVPRDPQPRGPVPEEPEPQEEPGPVRKPDSDPDDEPQVPEPPD